jgi:tetrahydromethanopterin S-methyltransferase subunit H
MFKFNTPQKIFEIGGIKIGGQPGELPTTLIGSIFYEGQKIVEDPKRGVFDMARAEELIVKQEELSDLTGNPCMLDMVCTSIEAARSYPNPPGRLPKGPTGGPGVRHRDRPHRQNSLQQHILPQRG